ncbi:GNAT family N-acetyltransferase [Cupriavidus basilensis]
MKSRKKNIRLNAEARGVKMRGISIRAAVTGQAPQIISILEQCGLDASALNLFATTFHIAVTESLIVGCAGVERHGDTAIIGPVAVLADYRDRGIASSLVQAALMRARAGGCRQAVMLAMRFATYFSRHGFTLMPRRALPAEVQASQAYQWQANPSDVCMKYDLISG